MEAPCAKTACATEM